MCTLSFVKSTHKENPRKPCSHKNPVFVTATTDGALSSRVSHLSSTFQTHDCCSGQFCAGVTGQNFASAAPGASHLLPRASARASWEGHRPSLSSPGACASLDRQASGHLTGKVLTRGDQEQVEKCSPFIFWQKTLPCFSEGHRESVPQVPTAVRSSMMNH